MKKLLLILCFVCFYTSTQAQFLANKDTEKFSGYFNFYYVASEGKIYLEVPTSQIDQEFLYVHALRTGLGSNDIGLDRGQLGGGEVVKFIKSGKKLLLLQPNLQYRANTDNVLEKKSIEEAFAKSVLFGFDIKDTQNEVYLLDITSFLLQDTHGVAQTLKRQNQGSYKLDLSRSTLWMERTKAFPKNVEFEALLTLKGEAKGSNVRSIAPNSSSLTVIQHHSFVALPDSNYKPREFDPRCGAFSIRYMDYATPVQEPITKRYITRHRLEKKDPSLGVSEAKEPIIYYLDPGTPEPVRSALLDGARWWNEAFEAIGYKNAFQVRMLPDNTDPLDVRYNVIQWVHRSTRGWSYGASITDPRTGEIIKGHVSLGSLRIRQDFLIAQALMNAPFAESNENYKPMLEFALTRIRQLSAHEVGHTLGFAHNFAASTNNRASVMDYPHPKLSINNGAINFNNAYDTGIGAWDKVTVAYSYGISPNGDEPTFLKAILEGAFANGLRYITDSDSRAPGGAHAKAHLWDNGTRAVTELENILKIRSLALNNFSEDNIRSGEPYSVLEDVFVPLYFIHRYQTEATVKLVGGMDYDYALKDYAGIRPIVLPRKEQEAALNAILSTLDSKVLSIPKNKLSLFPPRAYGYARSRESFRSEMGVSFDALNAVATASEHTLKLLLHPQRCNRLVQQSALDNNQIGFSDVFEKLISNVFRKVSKDDYEKEVQYMIQYQTLQQLFALVSDNQALPQVRGTVRKWLNSMKREWEQSDETIYVEMSYEIDRFQKFPDQFKKQSAPRIPDGSPIGSFQCSISH